jgi:hypothetical protein
MLHLVESVPARAPLALALLGFSGGLLGTIAVVTAVPATPAVAPTLAVATTDEAVRVEPPPARAHEALPAVDAAIHFVFTAGGETYVELARLDGAPRHGTAKLASDDGVYSAIASLRDVPAEVRAWRGREVIVDSSCRAHVVDVALVARITGDPSYLGEDDASAEWTAPTVLEHGVPVIAAKLDGCAGTYARAADAPAIRVFEPVAGDDAHIAEARARTLASELAAGADQEWRELQMPGSWDEHAIATITARDAQSGTTWIAVHAHAEDGCGGPSFNFVGLFRVERDGTLTTVQLRAESLSAITELVDIDGDGMPEVVGRGWLAPDAAFETAAGETLASFETPFVGCPC